MKLATVAKTFALGALVVLPISCGAVFVMHFAKDMAEVASALLGVAAVLSLASFLQIGLLIRETRQLAARQTDTRQQALALARCMKDLTHRVAALEPAVFEAEPERPAAPPPAARPQREPAPLVAEQRMLTLPQRRPWGIDLIDPAVLDAGASFARGFRSLQRDGDLAGRIEQARQLRADLGESAGTIVVSATISLAETPEAIDRLVAIAASDPEEARGLVLGISQHSIRSGGTAQALCLARLARAGIRFMLTDVDDYRVDPAALAACGITHLRTDARRLIEAAQQPGHPAASLGLRLQQGGVSFVADGVDDARLIPELIDLCVVVAEGTALDRPVARPANVVAMPGRSEAAPPPLRADAADSVRYRAAG